MAKRKGIDLLEYYVLLPNSFASYWNVFHSSRFRDALMNLKAEYKKNKNLDLKENIRRLLSYCYCGKVEYEVIVCPMFSGDREKVDVYSQVMSNFNLFFEYLMNNWKHIPAKTYRQQSNQRKKEENNG